MKSFSRWRHVNSPYPYDPSVEQRMNVMLSNRESIIRLAEEQFRMGRISSLQHQEFLADLKRLNEYQNNPHLPLRDRWANTGRNAGLERMNADMFRAQNASKERQFSTEPVFIDGELRRLHFYGQTAIVFVANGEAREVCFQGSPIDVFLDEQQLFSLEFNKTREFEFDGTKHVIKFGSPSREVYLDGHPYKAQFGGSPVPVFINNKMHHLRLGGPQPSVEISNMPMNEMVANFPQSQSRKMDSDMDFQPGNNNNSVDVDMRGVSSLARNEDMRPEGRDFTNMKDVDMRVNPRSLLDHDLAHSPMRHSPGRNTPPRIPEENLGPGRPPLRHWDDATRRDEPAVLRNQSLVDSFRNVPSDRDARWGSPSRDLRPPGMEWSAKDQMEWEQREEDPQFGNYSKNHNLTGRNGPPFPQEGNRHEWDDWRHRSRGAFHQSKGSPQHYNEYQYTTPSNASSAVPPRMPSQRNATFNPSYRGQGKRGGYRMPNAHVGGFRGHGPAAGGNRFQLRPNFPGSRDSAGQILDQQPPAQEPTTGALLPTLAPSTETAAPSLDINSLFAKLISVGLIQSESSEAPAEEKVPSIIEEEVEEREKEIFTPMPAVELTPESLKGRYAGIVAVLYKGIQCASCGLRFSEVQNEKYRQHLDWHFRSNRREKDGAKKAFSRKWYYDVEDWTQFEEVEDLEDRARSFFELQADEEQFQTVPQPAVASVATSKEDTENVCVVCGERFELFWVEEEEEWHLKDAVRIEEKTYHPLCYEDFKKASEAPETPIDATNDKSLEESIETVVKDEEDKEIKDEEPDSKEEEKMESEETVEVKEEVVEEKLDSEENVEEQKEETMDTAEAVATENETTPEPVPEESNIPEEEIIGLISETDPPSEDEMPNDDSTMVVMQSGSIVMKVKAESIAQPTASTPTPPNADENGEAQKTDVETDTEDELILPPPDPRFTVLPPVQRGQELSGLCSIM